MAVPKRKTSKARRDKRRSAVWKLKQPAFSVCPQCGELKAPHKVLRKLRLLQGRPGAQERGLSCLYTEPECSLTDVPTRKKKVSPRVMPTGLFSTIFSCSVLR